MRFWYCSSTPVVGVRDLAEHVERAAHVHFLAGGHVEQGQIDRAAPAMARLRGDVAQIEQVGFVEVRIEEGLHAQVEILDSP